MRIRDRCYLAASVGLPVVSFTAYILWIWPRPHGTSLLAQVGPYLACLLTGLPFAWILSRGRAWLMLVFAVAGFIFLWIYAIALLCGVRDVCL